MWAVNNKLLPIFYNTEEDLIRPYIPVSMRVRVIDLVYKCGHPGPKSTTKLIKRKYVWPRMAQSIGAFVKNCLSWRCQEGEKEWTKALPLVMLGLRTSIRSDIDASPAEMICGSTFRLSGEFFSDKDTDHNQAKPFIHKNLATCSHVFVSANPINTALESPYKGPFKVHACPSKYFYVVRIINKAGREELKTVSTSRIKPAFGTFRDID
ncbi:hypothetical protein TKK_0013740 [Trichogramma kaykai]